jgi:serine O-acetyltransferase
MLRAIIDDIRAVRERDPAARSYLEIVLCYSGLHATIAHRVNHWLWTHRLCLLARLGSQYAKFLTGIEIHPGATIGKGFFIDHGAGTVIGETAEVGDNVTLFHGVTLGGTGKERGKRHPTVEDDVTVGAHAQILGSLTIGRGSVIGAGAVVLDPVPPDCTVVGTKAAVVKCAGRRVYDFRHDRLPRVGDPATAALAERVEALERQLYEARRRLAELTGEEPPEPPAPALQLPPPAQAAEVGAAPCGDGGPGDGQEPKQMAAPIAAEQCAAKDAGEQ